MPRLLPKTGTALVATSLAALLAAAPVAADSYQVERGDTLSGIAVRHGTSISALAQLNGLANPDLVIAGRTIRLPPSTAPAGATAAGGTTHLVAAGESLGAIATRYGTSVRALAELNALRSPNRIIAGSTLQIPASGAPVPVPGASQRHVVRPGETVTSIGARHGIASADLARWNGITGSTIYAGTSLGLFDPGPAPSGSITCPVPGSSFFNDWAFPRPQGRIHQGNDLFAPRGTPVRAPVSGTVTTATGPIGGLQFTLTDPAGNVWLGTHLDRFGATGAVQAGEVIGYVGDTGNARGSRPHLHLQYHPGGGQAVNPYPALRAAC
jgi:LysM repeat protein